MAQHRRNEARIVAVFTLDAMLPREVAPDREDATLIAQQSE
jgi:hypothetical protein